MWTALRFWRWKRNLPSPCGDTVGERFCASLLGEVSRSFRLAIPLLPTPALRTEVTVFYLTLRALDTIEDDMTVHPPLKERSLRQFPDCLGPDLLPPAVMGEGAEQELLQKFAYVQQVYAGLQVPAQSVIWNVTQQMAAGMEAEVRRCRRTSCGRRRRSPAEYNQYCQLVAGLVGEGLTHLFVHSGQESPQLLEQMPLAHSMGQFLQKVNIIKDVLEDEEAGRHHWPEPYAPALGDSTAERDAKASAMIEDALALAPPGGAVPPAAAGPWRVPFLRHPAGHGPGHAAAPAAPPGAAADHPPAPAASSVRRGEPKRDRSTVHGHP